MEYELNGFEHIYTLPTWKLVAIAVGIFIIQNMVVYLYSHYKYGTNLNDSIRGEW